MTDKREPDDDVEAPRVAIVLRADGLTVALGDQEISPDVARSTAEELLARYGGNADAKALASELSRAAAQAEAITEYSDRTFVKFLVDVERNRDLDIIDEAIRAADRAAWFGKIDRSLN